MSTRGRIILLVVVVIVLAGGFAACHASRDQGPAGTVAARTDDGHLRFRIPDSWAVSDCLAPADSCVQAGPPGGPGLVTVRLVRGDPHAGDPFAPDRPSPDPSGWIRSTVSGHPAVRVVDTPTPFMAVLLDDQGDAATVGCVNVAYVHAADADGCRLVMDTLSVTWP